MNSKDPFSPSDAQPMNGVNGGAPKHSAFDRASYKDFVAATANTVRAVQEPEKCPVPKACQPVRREKETTRASLLDVAEKDLV